MGASGFSGSLLWVAFCGSPWTRGLRCAEVSSSDTGGGGCGALGLWRDTWGGGALGGTGESRPLTFKLLCLELPPTWPSPPETT